MLDVIEPLRPPSAGMRLPNALRSPEATLRPHDHITSALLCHDPRILALGARAVPATRNTRRRAACIAWRALLPFALAIGPDALAGGPIAPGETVAGTLSGPSFSETWTIDGVADDVLVVSAVSTGGPVQTQLRIYAPGNPAPVAQSSCGGGDCGDFVTYEVKTGESGTFTIEVLDFGLNSAGSYNLTLLKLPGTLTYAGDLDGGPIEPGETRSGSATAISDLDGFTFSGDVDDVVAISCVRTSGAVRTQILVYAPGNASAVIASACGGGDCGDYVTYKLAQSGTHTIVIRDIAQDQIGNYRITFERFGEGVPISNDQDGEVLRPGDHRTSWIGQQSDLDHVRLYADAGTRLLIAGVRTSGVFETQLLLYAPGGTNPIAQSVCGGGACSDFVELQVPTAGIHHLLLVASGLTGVGSYNLSLHTLPGGPSYPTDLDGGAILPGQTLNGAFDIASDFDVFHFYGVPGDQVSITATITGGMANTQILLYPPSGGARVAQSSCGGGGCSDVVAATLSETGLYSIVVLDVSQDQTGTYSLTLAKTPSDVRPGLYSPVPTDKGTAAVPSGGSLSWDAAPNATSYDVYFGSDPLATLPQLAAGIGGTSVSMPALTHDTVYDWRVIAHTPSGDVIGPTWHFYATNGSVGVEPGATKNFRTGITRVEPNPAFGPARISYELARDTDIRLAVFDLRGARIRTLAEGVSHAGPHDVFWDGRTDTGERASAGLYYLQLRSAGRIDTRAVVRLH